MGNFWGKRESAGTFKDLIVWQKSHDLVLSVYRYSESFPEGEAYGLTSLLKRAATSVPANIAEGFIRKEVADKERFMNMAQDSLEECRYYLILARDLGYGDEPGLMVRVEEVSKMLEAYLSSILAPELLTPDFWIR